MNIEDYKDMIEKKNEQIDKLISDKNVLTGFLKSLKNLNKDCPSLINLDSAIDNIVKIMNIDKKDMEG